MKVCIISIKASSTKRLHLYINLLTFNLYIKLLRMTHFSLASGTPPPFKVNFCVSMSIVWKLHLLISILF